MSQVVPIAWTTPRSTTVRVESGAHFTLSGESDGERRVASDLRFITSAVRDTLGADLLALLLVGSYARGEGGIVVRHGRASPHNDYDLVAVVQRSARGWREPLRVLGATLAAQVGVDVDIWPIDRSGFANRPRTLFWLDVSLGGARVLAGDARWSGRGAFEPRDVPLDECGRLLMNRAVGLALSTLGGHDGTESVMARHGHKMALACGDALLLAVDRYQPTLRKRAAALAEMQFAPAVGDRILHAYRDAVKFHARPDRWRPEREETIGDWFAARRSDALEWHLRFEQWRVSAPRDPLEFVRWSGRLFPRAPDLGMVRSVLATARAARDGVIPLFPMLGHPRERLARIAAGLAYGSADSRLRQEALTLLGAHREDAGEQVASRLRELVTRGG